VIAWTYPHGRFAAVWPWFLIALLLPSSVGSLMWNSVQPSPQRLDGAASPLVVRRPRDLAGRNEWRITLDDRFVGLVTSGSSALVWVTPGPHRLRVRSGFLSASTMITVQVPPEGISVETRIPAWGGPIVDVLPDPPTAADLPAPERGPAPWLLPQAPGRDPWAVPAGR
jgi:hypothetical protein